MRIPNDYYFKQWVREWLKQKYWITPDFIAGIINKTPRQCWNYLNQKTSLDFETANSILKGIKTVPTEWVFKIERLVDFDDLFFKQ